MQKSITVLLTIVVVACACAIVMACAGKSSSEGSMPPLQRPPLVYSPVANGRAIFDTGKDIDGVKIVAQPPPLFGSCEACHRANGAGGRHFADGAVSADLRHHALVVAQTHPYTLASLERAISTGVDNEGKPLDKVMPHWRMSKRDLHDVAQYVLFDLK